MILEIAVLSIRPGCGAEFEAAFDIAAPIIAGAQGYISHELLEVARAAAPLL